MYGIHALDIHRIKAFKIQLQKTLNYFFFQFHFIYIRLFDSLLLVKYFLEIFFFFIQS